DGDDALPVNVIQHPGGSPKQLGIRNNLAARLTDKDLAYFTDTEGGSSGSPVCSDDWIVLALHKASTTVFGKLEFQGKKTAWVNVGTRVDLIIEDLEKNHAALWSAIGADIRR
ncbi:MAG: serine protease, partial [Pseudomonadota bacterium]